MAPVNSPECEGTAGMGLHRVGSCSGRVSVEQQGRIWQPVPSLPPSWSRAARGTGSGGSWRVAVLLEDETVPWDVGRVGGGPDGGPDHG